MKMRVILVAVGLLVQAVAGASAASWMLEFPNFAGLEPPRLLGYLTRPNGPGPFPAVVVLHGCNGFFAGIAQIADRLRGWGYVALAVDSLGSRDITNSCGVPVAQTIDAHAALHYLSQQNFVDPDRVAVLGYSMGGSSALRIVHEGTGSEFEEKFRAAVAYYPWCGDVNDATMTVPTMILIGASDDWTPAEACRDLADKPQNSGAPIDLQVYPDAFHSFNFPQVGPGFRNGLGHWLEYNEPAATDAEEKLRAFLAERLGRAALDRPGPDR